MRVAELKSNFVSSVSHDLKTPLALIQLFAETLELGRLKNTDRAQEYYRIINSEARKLTRLINNMLDFSKIEAGLRAYTHEAGRTWPSSTAQRARVAGEPVPAQPVHGDDASSSRRRAGPDRPGSRRTGDREPALERDEVFARAPRDRWSRSTASIGYGVVRVHDRGIGIPRATAAEDLPQVLSRFRPTPGSGPQGTGLGLAIVDHVMRGHGGFVRVDSEPGRGSTFTLHFPLSRRREPR